MDLTSLDHEWEPEKYPIRMLVGIVNKEPVYEDGVAVRCRICYNRQDAQSAILSRREDLHLAWKKGHDATQGVTPQVSEATEQGETGS